MAKTTIADLAKQIAVLETTVIGQDGNNGLRSRVNKLEDDLEEEIEKAEARLSASIKTLDAWSRSRVNELFGKINGLSKEVTAVSAVAEELRSQVRAEFEDAVQKGVAKALEAKQPQKKSFKEIATEFGRYAVFAIILMLGVWVVTALSFGTLTPAELAELIRAFGGN